MQSVWGAKRGGGDLYFAELNAIMRALVAFYVSLVNSSLL